MKISNILTRFVLAAALFLPNISLSAQVKEGPFTTYPDKLVWMTKGEVMWIEPFGKDALRFRASKSLRIADQDWTLIKPAASPDFKITIKDGTAIVSNGYLRAEVGPWGTVTYYNGDNKVVLREAGHSHDGTYGRKYTTKGSDHFQMHVTFESDPDERLYGMGQYQIDNFNLKGTVLELAQRNTQISIPFLVSDRGYGLLWNNPSIGRAELATNHTRFVANYAKQLDYVLIAKHSIAEVVREYSNITGKAPEMPYFATGFWQSKNRYYSQEELLGIVKEYKKRDLPISVIVADYFHWPNSGDWKFNEKYWPDPKAMVDELRGMDVELLVSVWPTVTGASENHGIMNENNYLVNTEYGDGIMMGGRDALTFVDVTNPAARKFFWNVAKKNYFDKGIRMFWLDEAEPEFYPTDFENLRYYMGSGMELSCIYPFYFAKAFYDGQKEAGQKDIINLVRCAWHGSQRFGTLLWSGDINGTYEVFRKQIKAGMNISLCGIPWWNTDIGGFRGRPNEPEYRELVVRWFQYGAFSPVMRLHGDNAPKIPLEGQGRGTGSPNEVWSFGDEAYPILCKYLKVRETLRPYIYEQMKVASKTGDPMMRPMFYDFPEDQKTYDYEYQYMFGPDLLVAPVVEPNATSWTVYLPAGAKWTDAKTGKTYKGGQEVTLKITLEDIPVFCKDGFDFRIK